MGLPGFRLHPLKVDLAGYWSVNGAFVSHGAAMKHGMSRLSIITEEKKMTIKREEIDRRRVMAKVILKHIDTLETIDRLIASYDYRRDTSIRVLEKRRDLLAKRARDYADSFAEDVDAEIVEAPSIDED